MAKRETLDIVFACIQGYTGIFNIKYPLLIGKRMMLTDILLFFYLSLRCKYQHYQISAKALLLDDLLYLSIQLQSSHSDEICFENGHYVEKKKRDDR